MDDIQEVEQLEQKQIENENVNSEDVIKVLNEMWQAKLDKVSEEFRQRLAERDAVIKQLINTGTIDNGDVTDSIVESINRERNFKKW